MTKREYFAAMAMLGLIEKRCNLAEGDWSENIARDSVKMADALLKALQPTAQ